MRLVAASLAAFLLALPGCLDGVLDVGDAPGPKDYVSSERYGRWVIEMDVVQGFDAPSESLATLQSRLQEVASKPDGIEVRKGDTLPATGGTWTQKELLALSRSHRDLAPSGNTVTIHLLLVDGEFENDQALGVTFFERSNGRVVSSGPIVIFAERLEGVCGPLGGLCLGGNSVRNIWTAVLVHEFGHAMGLVNTGAPMQTDHEDDGHPGHSDNQGSVMYYAVETTNVVNAFAGGPPTTFDADDRADLCALGGKCA